MKIRGILLEIFVEIDPEQYQEYVELEKGQKTLYVVMLRAFYGFHHSRRLGIIVVPYGSSFLHEPQKPHPHTR